MTNPAAFNTSTNAPEDPRAGLMLIAAGHLTPLFTDIADNTRLSLNMAISAVAAYDPETRADYVNAARTIAFSMAALAILGKAAAEDTELPQQMRMYGRAISLNRAAEQSERAMVQRRRDQKANPPAELPSWMDPGPETEHPEAPDLQEPFDDGAIQAAVEEAIMTYRATKAQEPAAPIQPVPGPITTPDSVIRYTTPRPDIIAVHKPSHKEQLFQNSSLHRMTDQDLGKRAV